MRCIANNCAKGRTWFFVRVSQHQTILRIHVNNTDITLIFFCSLKLLASLLVGWLVVFFFARSLAILVIHSVYTAILCAVCVCVSVSPGIAVAAMSDCLSSEPAHKVSLTLSIRERKSAKETSKKIFRTCNPINGTIHKFEQRTIQLHRDIQPNSMHIVGIHIVYTSAGSKDLLLHCFGLMLHIHRHISGTVNGEKVSLCYIVMHFVWRHKNRRSHTQFVYSLSIRIRLSYACSLARSLANSPCCLYSLYQTQRWLFNYLIPSNWHFCEMPRSIV